MLDGVHQLVRLLPRHRESAAWTLRGLGNSGWGFRESAPCVACVTENES